MESKTAKYVLGISLLAIWSILFFRVRERVNKQNDFTITDDQSVRNLRSATNEDFELMLTYHDPFHIKKAKNNNRIMAPVTKKTKPKKKVVQKRTKRTAKKAVQKKLPNYVYKGYIIVRGGQRVALINDGTRNYNLTIGEKIQASTLIGIYEDSIQMRIGEELISMPKIK